MKASVARSAPSGPEGRGVETPEFGIRRAMVCRCRDQALGYAGRRLRELGVQGRAKKVRAAVTRIECRISLSSKGIVVQSMRCDAAVKAK